MNDFFCGVFSFLGWINYEMFQTSHTRHHRYTLHPPEDMEVTQPIRVVHLARPPGRHRESSPGSGHTVKNTSGASRAAASRANGNSPCSLPAP